MTHRKPLECLTAHRAAQDHLPEVFAQHVRRALCGEQQQFAAVFVQRVAGVGLERDGDVRRQRPRGRGPDEDGKVESLQYLRVSSVAIKNIEDRGALEIGCGEADVD